MYNTPDCRGNGAAIYGSTGYMVFPPGGTERGVRGIIETIGEPISRPYKAMVRLLSILTF